LSKLSFNKNNSLSLGVEIELQLIDPSSGDLKPVATDILSSLEGNQEALHIKSEIFQSMLEIETPICNDAFEVGTSLRKSLRLVRDTAAKFDAQVMMSGTHPFAHYTERLLTPESRYFKLVDRNQWITRRLQIFGLHVHIGMRDGEHAIAMNNALCHYLPLILALSASSPFWQKEDTGLASSRITFFEAIPTGGHPYLLSNWSEFENLIEKLIYSKSITTLKDLWWDIRPNCEYGTIEIRIADCPPTIKEVEALVALIHTLALFIDSEISEGRLFAPPSDWILRENKWRASRYGVQAEFIINNHGTSQPFHEFWNNLREATVKKWYTKSYHQFVDFLEEVIVKGPSYARQRSYVQRGLDQVIQHLIRENENDQPEWNS